MSCEDNSNHKRLRVLSTADENIKLYLKYCLFINHSKLTETIFEVSEIILSVQSWLRSNDFTEEHYSALSGEMSYWDLR